MTSAIHGLSDIADRYDALICDVWGVIHNGRESFPAACDALARFGRERGPVVLLSNAPRPASAVVPQLRDLGVAEDVFQGFVTSGDATRALLKARGPGPAWVIGPDRDEALFVGLDVDRVGPEAAAYIVCTGLFDDEAETPEQYRETLAVAARRGVEMICANPDRVVQRGQALVYCAGALADIYEELGGPVTMAGKPYAPVYDQALETASRLAGRPLARERLLCVGDGIPTDIKGANAQGLDCLFVLGGIHAADADGDPTALLAEAGAQARWWSGELVW